MPYARISVPFLVLSLGAVGSLLACATGDDSFGLGPNAPVGTQSQGDDGGTLVEAGAGDDALNLPTPNPPASDDAAPSASEDAATSSDDATAPPVDAAPPPVHSAPPPPVDSGNTTTCAGYAPPSTSAGCTCDPTKHACAANGCYGGYYCKLSTLACETKPSGC